MELQQLHGFVNFLSLLSSVSLSYLVNLMVSMLMYIDSSFPESLYPFPIWSFTELPKHIFVCRE